MADFSQRVIWTALPTGVDGNFVTLTALVSPRLTCKNMPRAPLEKWPDFLNWPEHAVHATYSVTFAGVTAEAERVSAPDSAVWQALFGKGTGVYNHAFKDRRKTAILSYPMAEVHDFISKTYTEIGISTQDELPNKQDIFQEIGLLARKEYQDDIKFQTNALSRLRQGIGGRQYFAGTQGAFTLQELYHMPLAAPDYDLGRHIKRNADDPRENAQWRQHRFYKLPEPDDLAELIDFHQIISALNQYPSIMRLAGLAVDLRLPKDKIAAGPISGPLQLKVDWNPTPEVDSGVLTLDDVYPQTKTEWHAPTFEPRKRHASTPLSHGMLILEDQKRFRLMQLDVDGAGIKLRNTARSYLRSRRPAGDERPDPGGIATIRTVGLQLVEVDRHLSLAEAFDNSGEMQDALEAGTPIDLFAEDLIRGYHADILDETRGNGWQSLCRRDGVYKFLNTTTTIKTEDEEGMIRLAAQEAMDETDPTFKDVAKISEQIFAWTGWSLTAPRIGLAIDTEDKPDTTQNTAPPGLPLEVNFHVRGGSLPALRFGHKYRVRVRVADLAGNARAAHPGDTAISAEASPAQVFRRYEPVPVPVNALVQKEGKVEAPSDGEAMSRPAIRSYNADPADNTVPTQEEARRHIVPPRSSHSMAEMHGAIDSSPGRPNPALYTLLASKDGNLPEVKVLHEDPLTASSDLVPYAAAGETFDLPYLPDILARAAVVRLEFDPATEPAKRFEIPYYGSGASWPDAQAFKVRIFEDNSAAITFDSGTQTLNVPLAKAEVMRVRISHVLKDDDLQLLALWNMMKAHSKMTGQLEKDLRKLVLSGEHWMFTPWLDMELVHAVQKPLVKPAFLALVVNRKLGETAADITFRSPIHAKSTDKTELMGRWREPSDEPNVGPPRVINRSASAFETRLTRASAPSGKMSGSGRQAFDDTRFRRVRYRLEAPTRFKEFMPPAIRQNPGAMTVVSDPHDAFVENSAIPPVPEVVEVVPTFGWTRTANSKRTSSFRSGGGLRVWLKRPWFATGFG
ncbi:MAG: hypothetical protein IH612_18235 [Desulfofustis sp.]|nr:hypothetical protein [Desulfofustis sp.]